VSDHFQKLAIPPLGILSLVAEKYFAALGIAVITPPPTSRRTLDIGLRGSPEMLCIPCKLLQGNYVEAAEQGATDLILLGGLGACRLGYSAIHQARRLRDQGFSVRTHTLDLYHVNRDLYRLTRILAEDRSVRELVEPVRFLLGLLSRTEALETAAFKARPRERERGAVDRAWAAALERIAALRDRQQLEEEWKEIRGLLQAVDQDPDRPVLRLGLLGDVYTILTPFLNHNLEVELGRMGVEVRRGFHYAGRIRPPLPRRLRRDRGSRARRAGSPYLERDVGGFARSTVGEAALMAAEVDGLIHVAPFNCTPEVVAQSALVALQRERRVPVLNLSFDEHTGRAGVTTRLEAFVDMLWTVRKRGG